MKKPALSLETYSHNFYAQGAEPALDNISVGHYIANMPLPPAARDDINLLYVVSGTGILLINGQGQRIAPGKMAKLFPYHRFSIEPDDKIELWECRFPLSVLMYIDVKKRFTDTDYSVVENGNPVVTLGDRDRALALAAYSEMEAELAEKRSHHVNMLLGNLFRIMVLFDRECELEYEKRGPGERSLAWQALQRIHMYFNMEKMDAYHVAMEIGVDPKQLGYLLRRLTGKDFSENLHEVRIRNACAMMLFEELPIAFIARYVGYTSQATFFRAFKRIKGTTPEAYRSGVVVDAPVGAHRDTAWKILAYMLDGYAQPITPALVGESLYIGADTVEHICQVNFRHSFGSLLEQIRLTYACCLLGVDYLPVSDVALAVGFNSQRTFMRSFSKFLGTTPGKYRRSIRNSAKAVEQQV